jgi:N-acetylmuramoyl-L-alanine amidase
MENQRLKANTMSNPAAPNPSTTAGVVFRVQVGAFTKGKIPQNIQNMPDMMLEDAGRIQKVLVGNYWNIADARVRVAEVKRQGAPDAFIVAFRDGMRISVEEALKQ